MCNCKWNEIILGVIILAVVIWPNFLGVAVSKWVVIAAAVVLIIHALCCKGVACCNADAKTAPTARKRKRR